MLRWRKVKMKKKTRLWSSLLIFLLAGCVTPQVIEVRPKYSGDHTTAQIRGMWMICYQTRLRNMPFFPPPIHMEHCDCVVDKSRESYSWTDYNKLGQDNLTKFFAEVSIICNEAETKVAPEPTSI